MNVNVGTIEVGKRLGKAAIQGFKDKPGMIATGFLVRYGQPQFKRHVEPGRGWRLPIEFHPGKVVDGVGTCANQFKDAIQPALTAGNFQSSVGRHAKCTHPRDIGKEQRLELRVVRQIEEYRRPGTAISCGPPAFLGHCVSSWWSATARSHLDRLCGSSPQLQSEPQRFCSGRAT